MGGRAALHAAGHAAVNSVLALAPWLPEDDVAATPEPVKQLVGRQVLIVHGTNDERTDPELSFRLAERAKKANRDVCRFEVHSDGHGLHQHRDEVHALAADFVLGALFGRALRPAGRGRAGGAAAAGAADAAGRGLRAVVATCRVGRGAGGRVAGDPGGRRVPARATAPQSGSRWPRLRQQEPLERRHRRRVRVAVQPGHADLAGRARGRDRQFDHSRAGHRRRRQQGHAQARRDQAAQGLRLLALEGDARA